MRILILLLSVFDSYVMDLGYSFWVENSFRLFSAG